MYGEIDIRPYEPRFESDLVDICWRTGLMGESLEGTGRFEDRRLFGLYFCLHYPRFEPRCCFVAVAAGAEGRERAVGYVIGATDSAAQRRDYARKVKPLALARLFLYTSWRYPSTFPQALRMARIMWRGGDHGADPDGLGGPEYPAHLHIDLLPECQGKGVGTRLMEAFLGRLRELGCPGVFLGTSDKNYKALPFYGKLGFQVIRSGEAGEFWIGLPAASVEMAKKL